MAQSEPTVFGTWLLEGHIPQQANMEQRTTCTVRIDNSPVQDTPLIKYEDIFVDNVHIELSLWDTAGQEEFDRLRSLSYDDTHTIMLCFSVHPTSQPLPTTLLTTNQVDSKDSLENVESKWVGEIAENCQGVKLVLVALKCDLREKHAEDEEEAEGQEQPQEKKRFIDYNQGLEVARRIQALRYLGMVDGFGMRLRG